MLIVHMSPKHYVNGFSVFIYRGASSAANMLPRYPSCRRSLWELSAEDSQHRALRESRVTQVPTWTLDESPSSGEGFFHFLIFFFFSSHHFYDFICQRVWRYEDEQDAMLRCGIDGLLTWRLASVADVCEFQRFLLFLLCTSILKCQFWYQTCLF